MSLKKRNKAYSKTSRAIFLALQSKIVGVRGSAKFFDNVLFFLKIPLSFVFFENIKFQIVNFNSI